MYGAVVIISAVAYCCLAQRSPYAGRRPIGYPELDTTTTTMDPLGNRFGEVGTTERLPIEALGDRELVNRLSKLPIDQQPFWLLNWKHLEEFRKNPQTWQQRPNVFIENIAVNNQRPTMQPFQTNNESKSPDNRFGITHNMDNSFEDGKRRYDENISKHDAAAEFEDSDKKGSNKKHDFLLHSKGSH